MSKKLLKKIEPLLDTLESSDDTVVYALDETSVRVESDNRRSWSPVGEPPILVKNGCKKGVNIVGSTCILNNFHTVNDVYNAKKSITHVEIQAHLAYLIDLNPHKKIVVFMDNAPTHKSAKIQEFYQKNKDILQVILLPRYSPYMNPQETVWHYLKEKVFRPSDRANIVELIQDIEALFVELNSNPSKIRSLAYARSFLV